MMMRRWTWSWTSDQAKKKKNNNAGLNTRMAVDDDELDDILGRPLANTPNPE